MKMLQDLNQQGKTIILVTHNPDLTKLANKVIKLKDGKVIEDLKLSKDVNKSSKSSIGG